MYNKEALRKLLEDCVEFGIKIEWAGYKTSAVRDKLVEEFITYKLSAMSDGVDDGQEGKGLWRRYRFQTKSVDDYRPIMFNPQFPFWCSGYKADMSSVIIVAYLPITEDLKRYWDDAFDIEHTDHKEIEFSDRFPKPDYYKPLPVADGEGELALFQLAAENMEDENLSIKEKAFAKMWWAQGYKYAKSLPSAVTGGVKDGWKKVCYCGSLRFIEVFQTMEYNSVFANEIALLPCCMFADIEREYGVTSEYKKKADELHKHKIDICDEVYVLNVGGYIGDSTRSEIEYAKKIGKPIKYLEP